MRHLYKLIPGINRIAEYMGKYRSLGNFLQRMEEQGETELVLFYVNYTKETERRYTHTSVSIESKKGLYHVRQGKVTRETYEEAKKRTIRSMKRLACRLQQRGFSVKIMGQESEIDALVTENASSGEIPPVEEPALEAILANE
ncbi:MAG: hypothetical protein Q8L34_07010 [Candidatus Woesearchaeota archaeon]|nr:hypothetical protein [Candidatus Woesearchaeota archaeon]